MSCETCFKFYDRRNKPPPCDACLPELLPENENAVRIYNLVQSQTRDLPNGQPKDIDLQAVIEVLKLHNLYTKKLFIQVVNVCRHMIGRRNNG